MTMQMGARPGIAIAGTGTAFPSDLGVGAVLTNGDVYEALLGVDANAILAARGWRPDFARDEWGVDRREWIRNKEPDQGGTAADVTDLAARAAEVALLDGGIEAAEVDLLLAATSTPGRITSTLAAAVGRRLGVTAPCLDLRAGGAGGLAAWITAVRFLSDECTVALVVAAETPSLYLDPDDLATAVLYGDGAAALVLLGDARTGSGLRGAVLGRCDASGREFTVPGSLPPTPIELGDGRYRFQKPDGAYRDALDHAWKTLCGELRCSSPGLVDTVEHFLPYAVTRPQVKRAAAALGVASDRTFDTLARHGCVGCPGPIVGLDALRREGRAGTGQVVALAAVAGGISMTGILWQL
jgi:3-oxoacyl-[acyl-carrier-protein] synthase III